MQQKSIKKNMLMSAILTVSEFLFPIVTYGYVARVLHPDRTGQVAFVNSILTYFLYIASLGIPSYGRREVAKIRGNKEKLSELVQELFVLNAGSTLLSYVFLWIAVMMIPKLQEYSALFLIMGGQIALKLIGVEWLYQGLEEYSYITIRSLIFKTISVILTFLLIRSEKDVLWYGFVHTFTLSASYLCNFFHVKKYLQYRKRHKYNFKKHIKPILLLFSASIAITIYASFDISMLGFISTEYEVGLYNAAQKIKSIVLALSTAITNVLLPRVAYYFANKEEVRIVDLLSKSLRVSLLIAVPVAVYIIIFGKNVLAFIGGSEYIQASNLLRILMLCVFALIATNFCGAQILIPIGREKRYTQSVSIGLFINLILNWIMIPARGAVGAAIATLITELWNVFWMVGGCKDYLKAILPRVSKSFYAGGMVAAGVISYYVSKRILSLNVFWQLAVTAVVFFTVYYLILLIFREPVLIENLEKFKGKKRKK